ncbi:MAG: glycosyltransferase [Candidatus Omnitrophota bacterium]
MPKISVITPVHNAAHFIRRAVDSVLSQGYGDIEVIIVDDGSTDDLKEALAAYSGDGRVRCLRTEKGGVSHAVNKGMEASSGDYLAVLHADDIFRPGRIKRQVELMEKNPGYGVSYTNESYFLEGGKRVIESPYFHFGGDIFYFLKRNNFIHISSAMFRRQVLGREMLDERLKCHEDWDLFLRLSARGVRFLYIDEVLTDICVHPKSLTSDTALMDSTRHEVGMRAKRLWRDFKLTMGLTSPGGLLSIKRYLAFKISAVLAGFPYSSRYNRGTPTGILNLR